MPAHYRKLGDFHQYYYGTKTAPYLTIFIGGNHEASNHLFELHYGGWVAPNIYYLGAANVIKLGPLKIAGTSGVYKKYDYQKPHFERLPYSYSEMRSIYHQRELDIRKLLSYRSQVDIGLSHDWPAGMEWLGNHRKLFAKKPHFRPDASTGDFGSKPSAWVLDRLRPSYWFSAHHHCRYIAYKAHDVQTKGPVTDLEPESSAKDPQFKEDIEWGVLRTTDANPEPKTQAHPAIFAWNSFRNLVQELDAAEDERREQALSKNLEEQAQIVFEETFKEVKVAQSEGAQYRQIQPGKKKADHDIPQSDGSCCSLPKRKRNSSPSDNAQPNSKSRLGDQLGGLAPEAVVANPDAIGIDMSDSESDDDQRLLIPKPGIKESGVTIEPRPESDEARNVVYRKEERNPQNQGDHGRGHAKSPRSNSHLAPTGESGSQDPIDPPTPKDHDSSKSLKNETLTTAGLTPSDNFPKITSFEEAPKMTSSHTSVTVLKTDADSESRLSHTTNTDDQDGTVEATSNLSQRGPDIKQSEDISEDIRAQLAEMSSTFAPHRKIEKSPDLPFPQDITNRATRFLALSKVEKGRPNPFLQLLEIEPLNTEQVIDQRPYELEYDVEWLAITRVFAPELQLGGSTKDKIPPDQGQTYYREQILKEETWVQENIVDKGLLQIPKDFEIQTQPPDLSTLSNKERASMPRELTNPQTSRFCKLVGIANPFDVDEEQRDERMRRGPTQDGWQPRGGGGGRGRGRGGRGGPGGQQRGRGRGSN